MGVGSNIPTRWDPKFDLEILEFWRENKIYEKWKLKNKDRKTFFYLDGPPYSTGSIHLGTAWGKVLRDMVIRYYSKKGYFVFNRPGFDMHGLPIEQKVEKSLGITKKEIEKFGVKNFVEKCREFSYGNMYNMIEDFKREGVWLDWDNPYMTIANEYIERIWEILKKAYEQGLLYEDLKVVHWCPRCQTTLSKQEVELGYMDSSRYKPAVDPSIYVKLKLKDKENEYLLIWTTTPWTLTFNLGVMINPNVKYALVEVPKIYVKDLDVDEQNKKVLNQEIEKEEEKEYWWVARDLVESLMQKFGIDEYKIVKEVFGKDLEGLEYVHPFEEELKKELQKIKEENPNALKVWLSEEYVTTEEGTGLVHTAPGCGPEDYEVGKRYGVKPWNTTDEEGYVKELNAFKGWRVKKDDLKWVRKLIEKKKLVYFEWYEHDYPICWRCGERLIFRATKQWYINVQKLKEKLIEENKNVLWVPEHAKKAFENVISFAPDWVISRQRYWGIPLPIWKCRNGHVLVVGSRKELEKLTGKKFVNIYVVVEKSKYSKELLEWMFKNINKIEKEKVELEDIKNVQEDTVFFVKEFDEKILEKLDGYYSLKTYGENYDLYRIYNYDFHKPWIDDLKFKCPYCNEDMYRIPDVADVWLDSGGAFLAVFELSEPLGLVDFIVEGFDQLRGWFYTLAVEGMLYYNKIPYKAVYTHGWVNDALGRKMSKSLGNVVYPKDIWDRWGADTLRLYLASATGPYEDLNFYIQEVKVKYDNLNVLWNIHRYLIDQCRFYKINPVNIRVEELKFGLEEKYILSRLNSILKEVEELFGKYELYRIPRLLENLWLELSREYIKSIREKLQYGDEIERKTVLWTIYKVLIDIVNAFSTVCPFITEKIYQNLKKEFGLSEESIHLLEFPKVDFRFINPELEEKYRYARDIVEAGLRLRNKIGYGVRWPLKKVIIFCKKDIREFKEFIRKRLNVKEVEFTEFIPDFVKIKVKVKDGRTLEENPKDIYLAVLEKGYYEKDGEKYDRTNLVFEFEVPKDLALEKFDGGFIVYDVRITDELFEEGLAREVIRRVQDARKKLGLVKEDTIALYLVSDPRTLDAIRKYREDLVRIAGVKEIKYEKAKGLDFEKEFKIKDRKVWIGVKVLATTKR